MPQTAIDLFAEQDGEGGAQHPEPDRGVGRQAHGQQQTGQQGRAVAKVALALAVQPAADGFADQSRRQGGQQQEQGRNAKLQHAEQRRGQQRQRDLEHQGRDGDPFMGMGGA